MFFWDNMAVIPLSNFRNLVLVGVTNPKEVPTHRGDLSIGFVEGIQHEKKKILLGMRK